MINENPALDSIIQDSKKEITEEVERKSKGRGRPKKDSTQQTKTNTSGFTGPQEKNAQPMNKETYKMVLGGALDLMNLYLNKYTKTEIFTLSKEEKEMITETGSITMMDFMPTVNPMYINAIGFACVMGGIYGMKVQQYQVYVNEEKKKGLKVVVVE